ncbi:hypothetical protein LXL04_033395 [Taraxacum kok-saghyz]
MSNATTKMDMRRCFGGFGEIVDIFMGNKKDANGKNFAFVKFNNVEDIWKLEGDTQNITCAGKPLSVNIARYGRNRQRSSTLDATTKTHAKLTASTSLHHNRIPPRMVQKKAQRTYADVTNGLPAGPEIALQTPIILSDSHASKNWLKKMPWSGKSLA